MRVFSLGVLLVTVLGLPGREAEAEVLNPIFADRASEASYLDVSLGTHRAFENDYVYLVRSELYAQLVSNSGLGAYASVPLVIAKHNDEGEVANQRSRLIPHIEGGGIFVLRKTQTLRIPLRVGALHSTLRRRVASLNANDHAAVIRVSDIATFEHETTWLRLGVSPMTWVDGVFVRLDAGVDIPVVTRPQDDPPIILRANAAFGIKTDGGVGLMGEMTGILARTQIRSKPFGSVGVSMSVPVSKEVEFFAGLAMPVRGVAGLFGFRYTIEDKAPSP